MRARTRTWRIGGILLAVSGVLTLLAGQYMMNPFAARAAIDIAWAAGVMVFTVGFSRSASVVARRPLGMISLAVVAFAPLVAGVVVGLLPEVRAADDPTVVVISGISVAESLLVIAAGLVATVQIARLDAVPRRWRRMPLWALCVSVGAAAVQYVLVSLLFSSGAGQDVLVPTTLIGLVSVLAPTLGLGVLALIAAASERPDSVDVYRPA
ncbi:MAG: hypothetical protein K0S37_1577 [Microbacterium sp.]|jgi:hypothetical protein|nr:hypothetical protein [Microbacterium sp.]